MPDKKILIIDDDKLIRRILSSTLSENGYTTICAEDGKTGIEAAQNQAPDAIILDLIMPGMNGTEVLKKLKDDPKTNKIPVMILTAKDKSKDVSTSLQLGAKDFMVKPFTEETILIRVGILLGNK